MKLINVLGVALAALPSLLSPMAMPGVAVRLTPTVPEVYAAALANIVDCPPVASEVGKASRLEQYIKQSSKPIPPLRRDFRAAADPKKILPVPPKSPTKPPAPARNRRGGRSGSPRACDSGSGHEANPNLPVASSEFEEPEAPRRKFIQAPFP